VVKGYQNIPSFKGKKQPWYTIRPRKPASIIVPDLMWERNFAAWNRAGALTIHAFYEITPNDNSDTLALLGILNSSLIALFEEVWGRTALGEGAIRMMAREWLSLPIPDLRKMGSRKKKKIEKSFLELAKAMRKGRDTKAEQDTRVRLDDDVFEVLEISPEERQQVYEAVKELKDRRKRRIEAEVLIEHPETRREKKRRRRLVKNSRRDRPTLTKWFE